MAEVQKLLDENGLLFFHQQLLNKFVKQETGKGLSTNDLTDELLVKIQNAGDSSFNGDYKSLSNQPKVNGVTLSGDVSLDDLGITEAITNAVNSISNISFEVAESFESLPEEGVVGTFYLVPNGGSENNNYDEYLWNINSSKYEQIGSIQTEADLSGYVKHSDIVPLTNEEILNVMNSAEG